MYGFRAAQLRVAKSRFYARKKGARIGTTMASDLRGDKILLAAFPIIENTPEIDAVITAIRDLLGVDHIV